MTISTILALIGLFLSFAGSIIVACSVKENPGGANQLVNGKKLFLASISVNIFRWGIFLLVLGFFIQLISILIPYLTIEKLIRLYDWILNSVL